MSFRAFLLIFLGLLAGDTVTRAALTPDTPYTEQGQTDFDTALKLLNPYGTWSKIDDKWAFTPTDHMAPYTNGRWIYTEYGWYWKGNLPHSWATEHYGYWKRSADKVWSWYPGSYWLPETVELRTTSTYIGWRSAEVDSDGSFVEAPLDRYSHADEWTFVTLAQFANPITPSTAAPASINEAQLDDSTDCHHTYLTYREIDRPGPHPADIAPLCRDGQMLAPLTAQDKIAAQQAAAAVKPKAPATNAPTVAMTGTNAPALLGTPTAPAVDARQVKYWITMSLPTFWTRPPADAKPQQIYLYRPNFYQDSDGIARRITLWFNPHAHSNLQEVLGASNPVAKTGPAPATAAIPAVPVDSSSNPFRSPLDESRPSSPPSHATNSSSKAPAPSGAAAPDGLSPAK